MDIQCILASMFSTLLPLIWTPNIILFLPWIYPAAIISIPTLVLLINPTNLLVKHPSVPYWKIINKGILFIYLNGRQRINLVLEQLILKRTINLPEGEMLVRVGKFETGIYKKITW